MMTVSVCVCVYVTSSFDPSFSHWFCNVYGVKLFEKNWIKWQCGKWSRTRSTRGDITRSPSSLKPFLTLSCYCMKCKILAMSHFNHCFEFTHKHHQRQHLMWHYYETKCVKTGANQLQVTITFEFKCNMHRTRASCTKYDDWILRSVLD